jgi:PilZ domain-containing protein
MFEVKGGYVTLMHVSNEGVVREMRSAVRFPLHLPIEVKGDRQYEAEMRDISAGGVLFNVSSELKVGSVIEFTVSLPAGSLGLDHDVRVSCHGRIARTYKEGEQAVVAAVIDEYKFERE